MGVEAEAAPALSFFLRELFFCGTGLAEAAASAAASTCCTSASSCLSQAFFLRPEVFFFGIISSGKSTSLIAVLPHNIFTTHSSATTFRSACTRTFYALDPGREGDFFFLEGRSSRAGNSTSLISALPQSIFASRSSATIFYSAHISA